MIKVKRLREISTTDTSGATTTSTGGLESSNDKLLTTSKFPKTALLANSTAALAAIKADIMKPGSAIQKSDLVVAFLRDILGIDAETLASTKLKL